MPALDGATIHKLMHDIGGDAKVMQELVDTFLQEAPRVLASMQEAVRVGDQRSLNRAAHSLKSTSATFGAMDLSRMCRDLEAASERGWPADAAARVTAIVEDWDRVKQELLAWTPTPE